MSSDSCSDDDDETIEELFAKYLKYKARKEKYRDEFLQAGGEESELESRPDSSVVDRNVEETTLGAYRELDTILEISPTTADPYIPCVTDQCVSRRPAGVINTGYRGKQLTITDSANALATRDVDISNLIIEAKIFHQELVSWKFNQPLKDCPSNTPIMADRGTWKQTSEVLFANEGKVEEHKKLKHLMWGGDTSSQGEKYYVLLTTGLADNCTDGQIESKFSFVEGRWWKAVFDFDPDGRLYKYLTAKQQTTTLYSLSDFADNPESVEELFENEESAFWVVANGNRNHQFKTYDRKEWIRSQKKPFQDLVRQIEQALPRGRVIPIFLLFSKKYDVMIKVVEEIVSRFDKRWFTIADSYETAKEWHDKFEEEFSNDEELKQRSVIGLPWPVVNDIIRKSRDVLEENAPQIITSHNRPISLSNAKKRQWDHLEILGINQCSNDQISKDRVIVENFENTKALQYHKGGQIDWWNFHFGHVLKRTLSEKLTSRVLDVLKGDCGTEGYVQCVTLYHQPGAGGTTTARQVLWDLREKYRCAVIDQVVPGVSAKQIAAFHSYEDSTPKPVLLLLDDTDEDSFGKFVSELQDHATHFVAESGEDQGGVSYVVLCCVRQTKPDMPHHDFYLRQKLDGKEKNRFDERFKEFRENYNKNRTVNPEHLISFKIMKENFSKEYVKGTVINLIDMIDNTHEKTLLSFIALFNTFDKRFRALPISIFNSLMEGYTLAPWMRRWENRISEAMDILLVKSEQKVGGYHIRISHNIMSDIIFDKMLEKNNQTAVDTLNEFIAMSKIFASYYNDNRTSKRYVSRIVCDMVKKRQHCHSAGRPATQFAPLVEYVEEHQGKEEAAKLLQDIFERSSDVFVGQHLARFYIKTHNWERAEKCAKRLVYEKPNNSFVLDTLGLVYKMELLEKLQEIEKGNCSIEKAFVLVDLAFKAIDCFRKEQDVSKTEYTTSYPNNAGYFQEIATISCLLDCLALVPDLKEDNLLQKILVGKKFEHLDAKLVEGLKVVKLGCLQNNVIETIENLEDEYHQLDANALDEYHRRKIKRERNNLIQYRQKLGDYFGGECYRALYDSLSDEEKCKYRQCQVFQIGGQTYGSVYALRKNENGETSLKKIMNLLSENLKTHFKTPLDMQLYLCACLVMCAKGTPPEVPYSDLTTSSLTLYEKRLSGNEKALEPYLFVMMFNWPQQTSHGDLLMSIHQMRKIMEMWREAHAKKYPRLSQSTGARVFKQNDTTVAYLGNGTGMERFVFPDEVYKSSGARRGNIELCLRSNSMIERLDRWRGVLVNNGSEVRFQITNTARVNDTLLIPTAYRISSRTFYNQQVFAVIGFTWGGPKAFDISLEKPKSTSRGHAEVVPEGGIDRPGTPRMERSNSSDSGVGLERIESEIIELEQELMRPKLEQGTAVHLRKKLQEKREIKKTATHELYSDIG